MAQKYTFIDFDLSFVSHPLTGDVARRVDTGAVRASIKNLLMTRRGEKPFHPEIGSSISNLLFEQSTPMLKSLIEQEIRQTISNFEPRAIIEEVIVDLNNNNNEAYVAIQFRMISTSDKGSLTLVLDRTR